MTDPARGEPAPPHDDQAVLEKELEEGLEASFPASDPPTAVRRDEPKTHGERR